MARTSKERTPKKELYDSVFSRSSDPALAWRLGASDDDVTKYSDRGEEGGGTNGEHASGDITLISTQPQNLLP